MKWIIVVKPYKWNIWRIFVQKFQKHELLEQNTLYMRTSYVGKFHIILMEDLGGLKNLSSYMGELCACKTLYMIPKQSGKQLHHSPFLAAAFGQCGTSGLLSVLASEASDPLTDPEFVLATDHPFVLATAFASGMESDLDKQHLTRVLTASALAFQPSVQPAVCRYQSFDYKLKT